MANSGGGKTSERGGARGARGAQSSRNTRVYAPTHKSTPQAPARDKPGGKPARSKKNVAGKQAPAEQGAERKAQAATQAAQVNRTRQAPTNRTPTSRTAANGVARKRAPGQAPPGRTPRGRTPPERTPSKGQGRGAKAAKRGYGSIHRLETMEETRAKKQRSRKKKEPVDSKKLLAYLIAGVSLAGALLAGYFVFLVDNIQVEGNEKYSAESIISLSGLVTGRHLLLSNAERAAGRIQENPYVHVTSIEKELPRTIRITVEERREAAYIEARDFDVVIDAAGHVLSIGGGKDVAGLLRITGISQVGFQVNQTLGPASDMQVQALLSLLQLLDARGLRADIQSIDLTNPLRLSMLTTEGITVLLGQGDNLADKLYWMEQTLPSLRAGSITEGTLDVSAKGGAIYSPRGAVAPQAPDGGEPGGDPEPDGPGDDSEPNDDPEQATPAESRAATGSE